MRNTLSDFVVERRQGFPRDDAGGDVVGELFGLEKREVREDPDVTELVRDGGAQLDVAQPLGKTFLDGE